MSAHSDTRRLEPTAEYETLREELFQSRRYVLERPLLIAAVGIAAANRQALGVCLPVITGLLLFNFWFTVNRFLSSARIIAYIQLVLEEGSLAWRGWETSLRQHRLWHQRTDAQTKQRILNEAIANMSDRDTLMYYPAIMALHVFLIASASSASLVLAATEINTMNRISAVITLIFAAAFVRYCISWKPSRIESATDVNRFIWTEVLGQGNSTPQPPSPARDVGRDTAQT